MSETVARAVDATSDELALVKGAADTLTQLRRRFQTAIEQVIVQHGEVTVYVARAAIVDVARYLRDEPKLLFNLLSDLCGVDRGLEADPRFEVVYHLFSIPHGYRLRLKVRVPEQDCEVPTLVGVYPTAEWHERETFDLLGIRFTNHPDLRKILTPDDLEGHPLRKDFPLQGY
ncbi:MAG: NADH-quinone oxidoreductase subunit C [Acidobacteriota bacterium]